MRPAALPSRHARTTAPIVALTAAVALATAIAACASPTAPSSAPSSVSATPSDAATSTPASAAATPFQPEARSAASMTYDPTSKSVLLFGGTGATGTRNDLASWDGTAWTSLAADGPAPRDDAQLVADPDRGVVVLFGGRSDGTVHDDTWEWDGTAWTELDVAGPPARVHAAAAYDQASKRVLLYGGIGTDDVELHDTWAFDGSSWTKLDDVGIPDRAPNGMAFDAAVGLPVVLAVDLATPDANDAYPSSVWGWDGSAWNVLGETGPSFSPLQSFVETTGHPDLLDGGVVSDTVTLYQWSGEDWTTLATGGPPVRNGQAAAFDRERGRLVMFGGFADRRDFGDTWEFDGTAWTQVDP